MNITGSNFGTVLADVKVYLTNASGQIYELRVLSVTDGLIQVGLSGGLEGDYEVQVNFPDGPGDAVAAAPGVDIFSYSFQVD